MFIKKIYLWFFDKRKSYYNVFKRFNIIFTLSILKKNEISLFSSLLDIVVVDLLQFENDGRFLLNNLFLNYLNKIRIIIKLFNSYGKPIYSITSLYLSSN
jgi:NADH:ubiquinone oxidoreductase subunit C